MGKTLTTNEFHIGQHAVGPGQPCLVIAEVAQSHDGSLGMAHAYIDAIANAGAGAVKFQTHIASEESTPAEPWRVKFSRQDNSRYEYWKRMEFTPEQWQGLKQHADERGLIFLSSPFSDAAVDLLAQLPVAAWKVASGEVASQSMFHKIARSRLPVLLSTGMSLLNEVDQAVERLKSSGCDFVVMQCTSAYPCPPEKVGLNMLQIFRDRYDCAVGLSDHSGTIYPGLAAASLGLDVLEVHVTFSREMFGPDVPASVTTNELRQLVQGIRFIEAMRAHPVAKDQVARELQPLKVLFTKSLVFRCDLPAGTVLRESHLAYKKPGSGIPPSRLAEVINRKLKRRVTADSLLTEDDLENQ